MQQVYAIVPAAGSGRRFGTAEPKQFVILAGVPVLIRSLRALAAVSEVAGIVVAARAGDLYRVRELVAQWEVPKVLAVVEGGSDRQDSVAAALTQVPGDAGWVIVHDAARPLASPELIRRVLDAARRHGAAVAGLPVRDTIKSVHEGGWVRETLPREQLWAVQTPQAFRADWLRGAHRQASARGWRATDDAALLEAAGRRVLVVPGEEWNLKVTTPFDLHVAEAMLAGLAGAAEVSSGDVPAAAGRSETEAPQPSTATEGGGVEGTAPGPRAESDHPDSAGEGSQAGGGALAAWPRTGFGYDVHPFAPDRPLVLGGVHIPDTPGLAGHSDADVLLHAIMDALLGAAGEGDIGRHFPNSDPALAGISSLRLLERVAAVLRERRLAVVHIDATVVAERPRLAPFVPAMVATIARSLGLRPQQVNVKATTNERLGFVGRGEGMAAFAVATVRELAD